MAERSGVNNLHVWFDLRGIGPRPALKQIHANLSQYIRSKNVDSELGKHEVRIFHA